MKICNSDITEGTMNAIGFNPIERVLTDTSNEWTFVSKDAFTSDGEVSSDSNSMH